MKVGLFEWEESSPLERGTLQSFSISAQEGALTPIILSSSLWCCTAPSHAVMKITSLNPFKGNPLLTASAGECECGSVAIAGSGVHLFTWLVASRRNPALPTEWDLEQGTAQPHQCNAQQLRIMTRFCQCNWEALHWTCLKM